MSLQYLEFTAGGQRWRADLGQAAGIAIALDFSGQQPSFFNAPPATAEPLRAGAFTGDIAAGGSCRCATHTLTPHCNGTHTESVGHVVQEPVSIHAIAPDALLIARVISVAPVTADPDLAISYPAAQAGDRMITAAQLAKAASGTRAAECTALVVRTLPNTRDKQTRRYEPVVQMPPYFSLDAMQWIVAQGYSHLVVDLPSVDRAADDGRLSCHRIFWGLPQGSVALADARRANATITELAFIADEIADGLYLLNLQLAAFVSDASPSRPILYPLKAVGS
jgi:arylformamidase